MTCVPCRVVDLCRVSLTVFFPMQMFLVILAAKRIISYGSKVNAKLAAELRVGITHGSIFLVLDDIFGEAVNVAAKLSSDVADAGDVLADRNIWDILKASDTELRFKVQ